MKTLLKFIIYLFDNYINEDWNELNKIGRIIIKPFWFIRTIFVIVISPLIFIEFKIVHSKTYKQLKNEIKKELWILNGM